MYVEHFPFANVFKVFSVTVNVVRVLHLLSLSLFLLGVTGLSLEDTKGLTDLSAAGTPLFARDHEKCPTQLSI